MTADALPVLVLPFDDFGGGWCQATRGSRDVNVFPAVWDQAAIWDLVLLAGASLEAAMRARLVLARFCWRLLVDGWRIAMHCPPSELIVPPPLEAARAALWWHVFAAVQCPFVGTLVQYWDFV